jgi:hypothetical protein
MDEEIELKILRALPPTHPWTYEAIASAVAVIWHFEHPRSSNYACSTYGKVVPVEEFETFSYIETQKVS